MSANSPELWDEGYVKRTVGPGTVAEETIAPKPMLEGFSERDYVVIFNPLSDDFVGQVAQTKPANSPIRITHPTADVKDESDLRRSYGLNLKNAEKSGVVHITTPVMIRAGSTLRLTGDQAQVVVRQLVGEIMGRQDGLKGKRHDAHARHEVEKIVVRKHGSVDELMDELISEREQIQRAVKESPDEVEFPGVGATESPDQTGGVSEPGAGAPPEAPGPDQDKPAEAEDASRRGPGRPRGAR